MFWFKRNKIYLDCFTDKGSVAQDTPIKKASHFVPAWWKNLESSRPVTNNATGMEYQTTTMRGCAGFMELYKHGVMLPMWSDLQLEISEQNYRYQFAGEGHLISSHASAEHGNSYPDKVHLKFVAPWFVKEKTGVNFLLSACTWTTARLFPDITILPGIVNFKHQPAVNINMFANLKKDPYTMFVEIGTPLLHILPLSEKTVVPKIHVVSEQEFKNIYNANSHNKFTMSYFHKLTKHFPS
jgi:hypothetical protein